MRSSLSFSVLHLRSSICSLFCCVFLRGSFSSVCLWACVCALCVCLFCLHRGVREATRGNTPRQPRRTRGTVPADPARELRRPEHAATAARHSQQEETSVPRLAPQGIPCGCGVHARGARSVARSAPPNAATVYTAQCTVTPDTRRHPAWPTHTHTRTDTRAHAFVYLFPSCATARKRPHARHENTGPARHPPKIAALHCKDAGAPSRLGRCRVCLRGCLRWPGGHVFALRWGV